MQRCGVTPLAESSPQLAWDRWAPVLDDLDERLSAAETGDLSALQGWAPPPPRSTPVDPAELQRATRILDRQRALLARLRSEQAEVAAAMGNLRRPAYRAFVAPPVYVDRAL